MSPTQTNFNQASFEELADYFHGAPIGLHFTRLDGTIARTNAAELELLGYSEHQDEYVGHHMAEFHADGIAVERLLDRLSNGQPVVEYETTLVRRDGKPQRVLSYANAKMENGVFSGVRCCNFPHPEDLRPEISEIGALSDHSDHYRKPNLSDDERRTLYDELVDFFDNSPVALHIVGGDGLVRRANKAEFAAMGYDPESYIGRHIALFHADQAVIDGMLEDLVRGSPLINFNATLFRKDGSKLPVMIYSNSRMRDGSFLNTRCFTVPAPKARQATTANAVSFTWPRNEDFGFTVNGRERSAGKPNPMTLALKYIASRKRPEESLGFLARVSQVLGSGRPLKSMLGEVTALSVPFLADFASVDLTSAHLAHAATSGLQEEADAIARFLTTGAPGARFDAESVRATGKVTVCFNLDRTGEDPDGRVAQLRGLGIGSVMMIPMTIRDEAIGVVSFLRDGTSQRAFGPADQALAEEVGRRLSFAAEIDRLRARR
jgi:PAS domain S-box-containing protein